MRSSCTCFVQQYIYVYMYIYIYIKHILYNTNIFFVRLLNAFELYLFHAAIYIYIYNIYIYIYIY